MEVLRFLAVATILLVVFFSQFGFVAGAAEQGEGSPQRDFVDEWIEHFEQFFRDYVVASYQSIKTNRTALLAVLALVSGLVLLKTTSLLFGLCSRV